MTATDPTQADLDSTPSASPLTDEEFAALTAEVAERNKPKLKPARIFAQLLLLTIAFLWLVPIVTALYNSFRDYRSDTQVNGPFSAPENLSLDNYEAAWRVGDMSQAYWNTAFIVIPAVVLTLLLSSMVAFACTRFSWRFNIAFLIIFTAGNLMPPQVMFQPLVKIFGWIPWWGLPFGLDDSPDGTLFGTKVSVVLVHIAFQAGFCTFVLANYMKTIPKELGEAASVDGAGVTRQFFQVILPLTRPALAALATLQFTWIYNDYFWGVVLLNQGDERPITSSIARLNGQYGTDFNLVAAASIMIALPTLIVYLLLQKQFISGLTLGANKG
jgi:multiple sugar transport system permease protein